MSSALLTSTTNDPSLFLKQMELHILMRVLQVVSRFLVANSFEFDIRSGTKFINEHMLVLLSNKLKLIPQIFQPFAILSLSSRTLNDTVITEEFNNIQVRARGTGVKYTKKVCLTPRNATPATVVSTTRGLLLFEPSITLFQRQPLAANGSIAIIPSVPFRVILTNVSNQEIYGPKQMIIGPLCSNLMRIVYLNQLYPTSTENSTMAAAVSSFQSDNENMSSPKVAQIQAPDNRNISINIPDAYAIYHDDFIRMLKSFNSMSDEQFGHIKAAIRTVELNPRATRPIHSLPYRAGPKA